MVRSIGAVIAGYFVTAILTGLLIGGIGLIIPASLDPSNTGWVIANIVYGGVCAVVGGYVCGRISRDNATRDVLILAGIMLVFGIMTMIASLPYLEETGQPGWYYPVLLVLTLPATIAGGYLYVQQGRKRKVVSA